MQNASNIIAFQISILENERVEIDEHVKTIKNPFSVEIFIS